MPHKQGRSDLHGLCRGLGNRVGPAHEVEARPGGNLAILDCVVILPGKLHSKACQLCTARDTMFSCTSSMFMGLTSKRWLRKPSMSSQCMTRAVQSCLQAYLHRRRMSTRR